jgi:aminoglycoside phosphotransferase family enzyme/predicted kinase
MAIDTAKQFIESLLHADAYPHDVGEGVQLIETHISWVFLAGAFAYKIKKPIQNNFLDYSTLSLRRHYCEEELRLNSRFASDIYLDVVKISRVHGQARILGPGEPMEYAVQMKRFPEEALISHRLSHGLVHLAEVQSLAARIAEFHARAAKAEPLSRFGTPNLVYAEAIENCRDIADAKIARTLEQVELLEHWTVRYFESHREKFQERKRGGHIRECHGDLHLGNVVMWNDTLIPFDGIEFSEDFRWIDTLSDAAFTAMDFAAQGRLDFCHSFINAYFEATGDYSAINVLQWYLVYRAMVRAKVAALRSAQAEPSTPEHAAAERDLDALLALANRFTPLHPAEPRLWITYGLSGSGKTTGSEQVLQRHGAVRIRSDVERKRLAGLQPRDKLSSGDELAATLYSSEMTTATYQRLAELAELLIRGGASVIVDATFLLKKHRELFRDLAQRLQVPYHILAFHADHIALRQRISHRMQDHRDASDADWQVLEQQIRSQQHLEADELGFVGSLTD